MRTLILLPLVGLLWPSPAQAYDSGPRNVPCDYFFDGKPMQTDNCLVLGSGMNQGILWMSLKVGGKQYAFVWGDGGGGTVDLRDSAQKTIWSGSFRDSNDQCRPGGPKASIYSISNGDKLCLYES